MTPKLLVSLVLTSGCLWAQVSCADSPSASNAGKQQPVPGETNNATETESATQALPDTPPDTSTMLQLQRDFIAAFQELDAALQNITDKESADSAADQVGNACTRIIELIHTGRMYGRPDEKTAALLKRDAARSEHTLEEYAQTTLSRLLTIYFHNGYSSERLLKAIQPFMEEMLEGADTMEQESRQAPDEPDVTQLE